MISEIEKAFDVVDGETLEEIITGILDGLFEINVGIPVIKCCEPIGYCGDNCCSCCK